MTQILPKGWEEKTLKDVLDKASSNIAANTLKDRDGVYPIYGASGLVKNIDFYQQENEYLAIIKDGAGVGRIYHYPGKTSVLGTLQYLFPKDNIDIRFAFYYLNSVDFLKYYQGAAIPHIYYKDYCNEKIILPPLPEQKPIVEKLDKIFAAIDKAKAQTKKNLQNAKELFNIYLNSLSYSTEKLGKLVNITTGKLNANAQDINGKYPFFTCSREVLYINTYAFDCEAILLAGNNASADFNVKYYKGKFNAYQRTYIITIQNTYKLSYKYLYFQLIKELSQLKKIAVGANTRFLRLGMIKDINLALPSLEKQNQIVFCLDSLYTKTQELEKIYTKKLADLDELKQSVLQQAFSGKL